ncbi:MAG: hypothetical protein J6M02_06595, partial [Clostridia bacterium]|nr:hypothetical protein [Clostridia bacterium]
MKQVVELNNGVKVEISSETGIKVTSVSGKQVCFDQCGNLLSEEKATTEQSSRLKYFCLMGKEEREDVRQWLSDVASKTKKQADFLKIVGEALTAIDYNYRIVTIEPSWDDSQRLFYMNGEKVARGLSCREWKAKCKKFAPEWDSDLANLYELFLWYGYRIAKRLWT